MNIKKLAAFRAAASNKTMSRLLTTDMENAQVNLLSFHADASLYRSTNVYARLPGTNSLSVSSVSVTPQSCGLLKGISCGAVIGGAVTVCTASCLAGAAAGPLGGIPCYYCVTGFLGLTYGFCKDCLPAWIRAVIGSSGGGGGGGTLPQCCPQGTKCSCGGVCQTLKGELQCVGGVCLNPKQECP